MDCQKRTAWAGVWPPVVGGVAVVGLSVFQLAYPFVAAGRSVLTVPFAVVGLLAFAFGWRGLLAAVGGVAVAGGVGGWPVADTVTAVGVAGMTGLLGVALRRYCPDMPAAQTCVIGGTVAAVAALALIRGTATTLVGWLTGRPDSAAAGVTAGVLEWTVGVVLVPVLAAWVRPPALTRPAQQVEFIALLALAGLTAQVLFGVARPLSLDLPLTHVGGLVVLFGWALLRFHIHGSTAVAATIAAVVAVNAAGRGGFDPVIPFADPLPQQLQLLTTVGVLVAFLHFMAAVAGDRAGGAAEVARLHTELSERHAELQARAAEAVQKTAFLEAVLAQLPAGVMIVGPDGRILQRNDRHERMFGSDHSRLNDLPQDRMSTTRVHRVPFDRWPIVRAIRSGEVTEGYSACMKLADGADVDVLIFASPVRGPAGELLGAVSVLSDVTERNKAVRQLRASEQKLRMALQAARMTVFEWDRADGRIHDPGPVREWFRLPPDAPFERAADLLPHVHPHDADGLAEKVRRLMAGGPRCETVFRTRDAAGATVWVLSRSAADADADRVTTVLVDVTERQRHLDQLRLLESAVVHARDAVVILEDRPQTGGGRSVLYCNRAFTEMSGYTPDEVVGRSLHFLRGPNSDPATLDRLREALDGRRAFQCELLNYRKDGSEFWVELSVVPVPDPSGACSHWVMIQRDISDRKKAETELRQSREGLAEAQRIAHIGSWEYDPTTESVVWSEEKYRIFGLDPAAVTPTCERFHQAIHPDDRPKVIEQFDRLLAHGGELGHSLDYRVVRPSGEVRHVHDECVAERGADGRVVRLRGVTQDVTERRQAQEQLIQAQKMELIGQMAGGIAHDFNNVLTGVIGNLDLVTLPPDDPNRRLIETASRAAFRATDMTRKLLGFARKSQLRTTPVSLAPVIAEVIEFVGRTTDPRIELRQRVDTAARVDGDVTLLSQVLLNLCLNARDAMPAGGWIEIRADEVVFPDAAPHGNHRAGRFVRLSVEDTGSGIPPDLLARVFEPFFTTKPVGEGTGLGLAMVHGIVEQHNGWVEVRSEVGLGTRFDLYLPRLPDPDLTLTPAPRVPADAATPLPACPRGPKTVLLVDDEEMIRDLARAVLEGNGYRVIEARDGEEALAVFRARRDIDLVILDLTMPRMSGQDTFRAMIGLDPSARVLFSSGYSAETLADTDGSVGLLPKPYRPGDLLEAVGGALDDTPATAT